MSYRLPFKFIVCSLLTIAIGPSAVAWNSPGHMIIALVAYDQLTPAARVKALELLRAHPRYRDHFENVMPREVQRADQLDKDQWVFAHASTWPDQVRDSRSGVSRQDVTQYNRPFWHFVNEPIYLNDNERRLLQGEIRINRRRDLPDDPDDANMNIVQALKNSARIVRDKTASKEQQSVHLCWVMHLAGDSHQPLHAGALYTTHRFRRGDHGGNYVPFGHKWDLHAMWDEQISDDAPFETIRILATDLDQNRKLQAVGKQAAATLDPGTWIDESFELAKQYGYTKELLKKVADREGHSHLGPLDLPPNYRAAAEEVSERRAVEAGYRLAATIEQMIQ